MRRLLGALIAVNLTAGLLAAGGSAIAGPLARSTTDDVAEVADVRRGELLPSFQVDGENLIRVMSGAFDPLEGLAPLPSELPAIDPDDVADDAATYWFVQAEGGDFAGAEAAILGAGGAIAGFVADAAYVVRATETQVDAMTATAAVRAAVLYQPGYKLPVAVGDFEALLDLAGEQTYRLFIFDTEPDPAAVRAQVAGVAGTQVVAESERVMHVRGTNAALPALASIVGVEWIELAPVLEPLNAEARWVNDTGERDEYMATAPGRLTGAGQTAGVADTDVNYLPDFSSGAQSYFRDCADDNPETGELGDGTTDCVVARYTQTNGGNSDEAVLGVEDNETEPRKVIAYFDLGDTGGISGDPSNHGTHVAGSVVGDTDVHGTWDRADGMAPGANLVHQNIGTPTGGLATPTDPYLLWAQAYRPRDPAGVPDTLTPADYVNYVPEEDARTHNNSYGLVVPVVDLGDALAADQFVWDHEDMFIVASAGNDGPGPFSIGAPSNGKNVVTSGASANGRQPMASIDSMAIFSSHGPSPDGRFEVDLVTPGQIVISPKGGTADEEHYLQGTSMSGPILTGLATLVREYFYEGYGPSLVGAAAAGASATGFAVGAAEGAPSHNPSAALVRAALVNGAERMRGRYTGTTGEEADDGQYPSAGQGFGLVNLENSLYFDGSDGQPASQQANWYTDVWRSDADAFGVGVPLAPEVREYAVNVDQGGPFSVTLAFTDAPSSFVAGTVTRVNDLDLVVIAPDGTQYAGNNFNTQVVAGADEYETLEGPSFDNRNTVERVRIPDVGEQPDGPWTIQVIGRTVAMGPQGFALAASGPISEPTLVPTHFVPETGPRQVDVAGVPEIVDGSVRVTTVAADLAEVTWETNEPTTGTVSAVVDGVTQTYIDSYNLNAVAEGENEPGYEGIEEGPVETSEQYADRPVVSTHHEVLVTGLRAGESYELTIRSADLAAGRPEDHDNNPIPPGSNEVVDTTTLESTDAVYGAQPFDIAMLTEADTDVISENDPITDIGDGTYGTSTQLYTGRAGGAGYLGAFMFRVPDDVDPSRILGAAVEMTSAHDITSHYNDDIRLFVDLLPEEGFEPIQTGGSNYTTVHEAPAEARLNAQTGYRRGGGKTYTFAFQCDELDALRQTLDGQPTEDGEQLVSFRFDSLVPDEVAESLFSMEVGFNRRSRGADLRPQLVLFLEGEDEGVAEQPRSCDPDTPAPVIRDVGVQPGVPADDAAEGDPGSVVVSWRTDVPSDSTVFFRPAGSTDPFTQVGSDSLTTAHAVEVFGLDPDVDYVFGVRSATCNGATTTDDNGNDGYSFGPVAGEVVEEPEPEPIPTEAFFFHNPPPAATFDQTEPTGEPPDTQTATIDLDSDTGMTSMTWSGDFGAEPRNIVGDVTFDWWWSSPNPAAAGVGVDARVTLYADPDDFADLADAVIGAATVTFPFSPQPVEVQSVIEVNTDTNPVDDELRIVVSPIFIDTGPGLTAHYDADSTPSGFTVPLDEGAPAPPGPSDGTVSVEPDPEVGPEPAASANQSIDLDGIATRAIPTDADKAAGTCRCGEVAKAEPGPGGGQLPPAPQRVRGDGPDSACDVDFVPDPRLEDILGNTHERSIRCIAWYVITFGTGDADGDGQFEYTPRADVTREQMASFIFRLAVEAGLPIPSSPPDRFEDDEESVHEGAINAAAALGLIFGKGDLDGDGAEEFDPRDFVTRGQMAAFIARVHQVVRGSLPAPTRDHFEDDDASTFAASIAALAELGVITGVGDRDGDGRNEFAPDELVSRAQMATFIANELGLLVDSGDAEPGGSEVYVETTSVPNGDALAGDIETNKVVTSLTANGCGLTDAPVDVESDNTFSLTIPASQPAGPCELSLRAVTTRPGETATQTVVYVVDLTVT